MPTVPANLSREKTASSLPVAEASALLSLPASPPAGRDRFGVGVPRRPITNYPASLLGIGWYLNWGVAAYPARPNGADFWQMIRVSESGYSPGADAIRQAAAANPGSVWLIGNEPDVLWQDNTTPGRYAQLYHDLYTLLKEADPACRVAIAGVSQPTPLRLAYLDRILSAYQAGYGQPIPVDVWNVHNFILREERDSWGVGIPPGINASAGKLYDIDDHDNLQYFRQQIVDFRRWLAERGQRDKPLVVSEYGLLMPSDYGFDTERVRTFMTASFDYFLTAADGSIGYPQDNNRLVQWWCWYSLSDTVYDTGNLVDPYTGSVTPLGFAFANYNSP